MTFKNFQFAEWLFSRICFHTFLNHSQVSGFSGSFALASSVFGTGTVPTKSAFVCEGVDLEKDQKLWAEKGRGGRSGDEK